MSQVNTDYQQNNTPDKVLAGLLQSGIAGGKMNGQDKSSRPSKKTPSPLTR